ncbi:hypothetical protein LX32DRAFT_9003 [Colletotrichum zoysiae]|uniref:Uncharacterized protein n=1 Tax=Colletotrichum zoysiae TaxID=1216348 RepID=A0AAD9HED7_9PEZI|nr:hypothetical protein LX32DRAFT_9003 [Colletotrichum zoysiae]
MSMSRHSPQTVSQPAGSRANNNWPSMAVTETWAMATHSLYQLQIIALASQTGDLCVTIPEGVLHYSSTCMTIISLGTGRTKPGVGLAFGSQGTGFHQLGNQLELLLVFFACTFFTTCFHFLFQGIDLVGQRRRWVPRHQVRGSSFGVIPGWKDLTSWANSAVSVHSRHEAWVCFSPPRLARSVPAGSTSDMPRKRMILRLVMTMQSLHFQPPPFPCYDGPLCVTCESRGLSLGHESR